MAATLNLGQMAHRCPDSKVAGKAELPGYRLLFRGGQHNAHATIEKSEGHTVPALLWKVSVRDEALLDRYEGYPYYYDKVQIPVELDGKTGVRHGLRHAAGFACNNPSSVYLHTVRDGYQAAGFDQAILDQALVETRAGDGGGTAVGPTIPLGGIGDIPMDYDKLKQKKEKLEQAKPSIPLEKILQKQREFEIEYAHNSTALAGNSLT